jgi:hypothetical protein
VGKWIETVPFGVLLVLSWGTSAPEKFGPLCMGRGCWGFVNWRPPVSGTVCLNFSLQVLIKMQVSEDLSIFHFVNSVSYDSNFDMVRNFAHMMV